jgi:hypothetical protein
MPSLLTLGTIALIVAGMAAVVFCAVLMVTAVIS